MPKLLLLFLARVFSAIALVAASACSPTYDWREVRGTDAPFAVLLPAKPSTHSRAINLDGMLLTMSMTAAEVNGVTFAVGSAKLPEQAVPQSALNAMKTALVRNINGTVRHEKSGLEPKTPYPFTEIEAVGIPPGRPNKEAMILHARFIEKNGRIYQAIVVGPDTAVPRETVDTFFTSFKLN